MKVASRIKRELTKKVKENWFSDSDEDNTKSIKYVEPYLGR